MYKRICKQCGREFEAARKNKIYCSDKCRKAAFMDKQNAERKERIKARLESNKIEARNRQSSWRHIPEEDPRSRLVKLRAHGLLTPEYWTLYAEVDKQFDGGSGIVNGIPTDSPNFAEAVLSQIIEDGRIHAWINKDKENIKRE